MMNDRFKELREYLELTQEEFGKRINIQSRAHISALENGTRNITDRIVNDTCREFGISEDWLRYGKGKMRGNEEAYIKAFVHSLGSLDRKDMEIIEAYLRLDEKYRIAFRAFLDEFTKNKNDL